MIAAQSLVLVRGRGLVEVRSVARGEEVLDRDGQWVVSAGAVLVAEDAPVVALRVPFGELIATPDQLVLAAALDRPTVDGARPAWTPVTDLAVTEDLFVVQQLAPEAPQGSDQIGWFRLGRGLGGDDVAIESARRALADALSHTTARPEVVERDRFVVDTLAACGAGTPDVHLPPEAFTVSLSAARWILLGVLNASGDFSEHEKRWECVSRSRALLAGAAYLMRRVFHVVATIAEGHEPGSWRLTAHMGPPPRALKAGSDEDGIWTLARRVTRAGNGPVFDLPTASGSCVVEGITLRTPSLDGAP